jgi:hypothetical protein
MRTAGSTESSSARRPRAVKAALTNVGLLLVSVAVALLLAELLARIFLDPVDYLNPTVVADEFLNHRIEGHTGGHDAWGFRNGEVPGSADIVCIGDSMTYGYGARARESWPAVLSVTRGQRTYNMALGGYGPIQYLYLMQTRAAQLHPKIVIVALNLGNDLLDAYNMVYSHKRWSMYKTADFPDLPPPTISPRHAGKFLGGLRDWLSARSVLYMLITQLPFFDFVRVRESSGYADIDTRIRYHEARHNTIFYLHSRLRPLDLTDPQVKSGLEITKRVMVEIQKDAERNAMRLIVAIVPTKQRVYGDLVKQAGYLAPNSDVRGKEVLAKALRDEDVTREAIVSFLRDQQIEVVDLLPALSSEVAMRDAYPETDSHPNRFGYRAMAGSIDSYLGGISSVQPRASP